MNIDFKFDEENFSDVKSLDQLNINKSKLYNITKRIIDIIGAIIGLIILSPIFLIVAILIKIEDPKGKVIFTQERCGIYPTTFKMYKFRSMVYNADEILETLRNQNEQIGPAFKMKNDPRVTKVGKFIRKTSIDELPQLINVLKGDMSLVGPRPPLPYEVKQYDEYQLQRLMINPGITCIWQVEARNSVTFDEWVEMDLYYIKNRNIILDIKLILKTVKVLFGDSKAC